VDEPLAPLPDEPDIIEGDEGMDLDETIIIGQEGESLAAVLKRFYQSLRHPSPSYQSLFYLLAISLR
jgi:hypothetical protein